MKDEMLKKNALQKTNLALLVLLFCGFALLAQTKPPVPEYKIPPEAAAKANPVKPTAESLAKGKKLYGYDCAMCHGKDGDGKGDDMPPEGDRAKDDDIWNMVNYIRSLAKK